MYKHKYTIFCRKKVKCTYMYSVRTPNGEIKYMTRLQFKQSSDWKEYDISLKTNILSITDAANILSSFKYKKVHLSTIKK